MSSCHAQVTLTLERDMNACLILLGVLFQGLSRWRGSFWCRLFYGHRGKPVRWGTLMHYIQADETIMIGGSPIGLAGCGIWLFFALIFGIWAENRGGKRELQLRAGAGFRVFMGLGCGIRKRNSAGYRISILTWSHKLLLTSVPRSFLVFLVFRPFPERLVCFGQDGHTEWPRLWFTERYELRHHILWKGMPSFGKQSSEARFQGKWRRWKLWKRLFSLFTGPAGSWIKEWTIFFFHCYVNKSKRNRLNIGDRETVLSNLYAWKGRL